jgi:NAD(P)-dependent dehydrogenase (short-subunit alcohol dehydrogenase family)
MAELEGAVVIVTGAGRGIGRAIAEELGAGGAHLVINYANSAGPAEDVAAGLRDAGRRAIAVRADVADATQADKLVEATVAEYGRIDVLVNNAGVTVDRTLKNLTIGDWNAVIQTNLNGYFYTLKAALPYFMDQKSGKIIQVSSFVGKMGNFGQANYAAAKAGILGLTKTAAIEMARYNVTVNAVCPGFTETDMYTQVPDHVKEQIVKRIPLGRVGTAQEVARAVRYLIVDGDYITGSALDINGGIYM